MPGPPSGTSCRARHFEGVGSFHGCVGVHGGVDGSECCSDALRAWYPTMRMPASGHVAAIDSGRSLRTSD